MKFSFVIPVFKTEQYLARCLDSLVAQSDGGFEAIVVDDASPGEAGRSGIAPYQSGANPAGSSSPPYQAEVGADPRAARYSAAEIVARYDARFRYVRQDRNRSTFQAKATGAKLATGDYIVPLDSDDYVLPRLVEELKEGIGVENRCRCTKDVRSCKSYSVDADYSPRHKKTNHPLFNLQPPTFNLTITITINLT